MQDKSFMTLMKLLPKSALSSAVGVATRAPVPAPLHRAAMKAFARAYDVALDEAEHGVEGYRTFGEFFTRRLKPGARPIDMAPNVIASPVDGAVSQAGYSENGQCIQAKGITYSVERLLGDAEAAKPFVGGAYATLYLAPRDYHRIHSPLDGEIEGYSYVPGAFWPVNQISVRSVDALFCINERLTTYLRTKAGRCAVVKVGATCVARIRASYDDVVTHAGTPGKEHRYESGKKIGKGDELGMFEMGSTVILLFEKDRVRWDPSLVPLSAVQVGKRIGELL